MIQIKTNLKPIKNLKKSNKNQQKYKKILIIKQKVVELILAIKTR